MLEPPSLPDAAPELIERGAPRTNQAVAAAAVFAGWLADVPMVVLVVAVVLWIGSAFGRRFVPAYLLYFGIVRPLMVMSGGEPWLEDERMPRFAQAMGGTVFFCAYAALDAEVQLPPAMGRGPLRGSSRATIRSQGSANSALPRTSVG